MCVYPFVLLNFFFLEHFAPINTCIKRVTLEIREVWMKRVPYLCPILLIYELGDGVQSIFPVLHFMNIGSAVGGRKTDSMTKQWSKAPQTMYNVFQDRKFLLKHSSLVFKEKHIMPLSSAISALRLYVYRNIPSNKVSKIFKSIACFVN